MGRVFLFGIMYSKIYSVSEIYLSTVDTNMDYLVSVNMKNNISSNH